MGTAKYGTALKTFNGRSAATDLLQELYDASLYCRQMLAELQVIRADALAAYAMAAETNADARLTSLLELLAHRCGAVVNG